MRRGGKGRSYPRLVYALNWSSRSRGRGSRDVNSGNIRCGRADGNNCGWGGIWRITAGAGEEGCTRGR